MAKCAEGAIRELKKGTARKMLRTGSPKVLWDDCMELESEIRSSTVNDAFELDGEDRKTKLRGETANITHICEFGWYDWVYYRENAVTYPDDKWDVGRWLGPSMDIGPALCAKILKSNGQRVHRSSYHHLTEDEVNSPNEKEKRQLFDRLVDVGTRSFARDWTVAGAVADVPRSRPSQLSQTSKEDDGTNDQTGSGQTKRPYRYDSYVTTRRRLACDQYDRTSEINNVQSHAR